jgi:hypothetical protein
MLISGVVLLDDNARPLTNIAARTRALLEHFNWELFDHSPYSPDLAPRTTTCLPTFNNNEELMEGVKMWLSSQAADFFDTTIQKTYSPIRQEPQFRQ